MAVVSTLKNRSDFVRMTHAGARYVTPAFVVQYMPLSLVQSKSAPETTLRFGFTASKKVGNAVCRNRAKRRMRALVSTLNQQDMFHNIAGDFVLIARHNLAQRDFSLLQKDFQKAMQKLVVENV